MSAADGSREAVRRLLDGAAAAEARADWPAALTMAEAAAALTPDDEDVVAAIARARAGSDTRASETGTRRRVTVMFCDLAGSTEIAAALDPEETREILHAYHEACGAIVRRYDGHVAHLMSDGLLVYFGYPRAHEDDGVRAVLAARAMVDATPRLRAPGGAPWNLRVRVGIHTGLAVIADMGTGTWARPGDLVGETPNLAARVQAAADVGTVVLTADVYDIVRGQVEVEPLGPRVLKGISRPIELYEVVGVRGTDDETAGDIDGDTVGRELEHAAMDHAWAASADGGGYVVLSGEPGIGKSHLLRHARRLAKRTGGQALTFRCRALHANTPLHSVVQPLTSAAMSPGSDDERIERLSAILGGVGLRSEENVYLLALLSATPWPPGRPQPDVPAEQVRERMLVLVLSWLDALAARGPLLVAVEDLHWADPSTIDLIRRCVTEPRPHPMLVVVTTRDLPDTVPGEPSAIIELAPLDMATCEELVDLVTDGQLDDATRRLVVERGDGVPLYVRELAKMLASAPPKSARPDGSPTVPPTLNDLLVARLDAFRGDTELIGALAVIGRPAVPELVASMLDRTTGDVHQRLDVLESAGILRYVAAPPRYDFNHALLRDTAYSMQLLARRRGLHRRAAVALRVGDGRDDPTELAHHFRLAGDIDAAVEQWLVAGSRQAALAAHAEAVRTFELALEHLPEVDADGSAMELAACSGLAASLLASRGYFAPEVATAYARVRELSASLDAQLALSGLYGLWAYYHVTGDAVASLEAAEALVRSADELGVDAGLAARAVLGYQLVRFCRPVDAIPLLEAGRGCRATEPLLPHHPGIGATIQLALAAWLVGDFSTARRTADEATAAAEALDGPTGHFTRAYTHAFAAELFQLAGDPARAAQHAGRAVQVSAEFGFTSWLGAGMTNLKIGEALCGDLDGAVPVVEYCLGAWRAAGAAANLTQFGLGLALAYRAAGRADDALATIEQALTDADAYDERYVEPELHRVRGELLGELAPDDPEGGRALVRAREQAAAAGATALELRALTAIEHRHRSRDDIASSLPDVERLLALLDVEGAEGEPVLAEARALVGRAPV